MKNKLTRILLIGYGKVGSSFAFEINALNDYKIIGIIDKNVSLKKNIIINFPDIKFNSKITKNILVESDIISICVEDKCIQKIINDLIKFDKYLNGKIIFHTSGSLSSELFSGKRINIENVGSFHPIQTFKDISIRNQHLLSGIYFGIEGGRKYLAFAKKLCKKIKSKAIIIPKDNKYLYHAVCVFSSNFLVSYFNLVKKLSKKINIDEKISFNVFKPLVINTFHNIENSGTNNSITGPFERDDRKTILMQIKELKKNIPEILKFYEILGSEAINLSLQKNSIKANQAKNLREILKKSI